MTDGLGDPRRLAALAESGLVDSPPEQAFDRVTRLVAEVLHVPVALFTLVTDERQVFKSSVGLGELRETPLSHSFCRHVVDSGAPLEVVDARKHPKVRDNPSIEEYGIVAYLGVPLTTSDGVRLGALCAIDHEPREWTGRDHGVLEDLAGAAMAEVELRRANRAVAEAAAELHFAATHDSLTRLGNRRALLEDLGAAAERPAGRDVRAVRRARDARGQRPARARGGRRAADAARRAGWRPRWSATATSTGSGGVQLCALLAETGARRRAGRVRRLRRAELGRARGRLSRGDGRDPAGGEERRLGAAPRGRSAGTLRACCDRSRLTSRNAAPPRGSAGARRRSPASTTPGS